MLINNDHSFIVESEPKVFIKDVISFTCCGEHVASIDAEYDLSDVPPSLHGLAIGCIQKGTNICLPYDFLPPNHDIRKKAEKQTRAREAERELKKKTHPWWRFW